MKLRIIFLLSFFFSSISFPVLAQNNSIEGKVIDSKTNEPLAFVSVYLSGTTIGTSTDISGQYRIKNIPNGNYIIVASMVGYESRFVNIKLKNDDKIITDFSLDAVTYKLNQIEITGEVPSDWRDHLNIFKKYLFGNNQYANECEIKNPYIIDFTYNNGTLSAKAAQPLIIQNNALGYKIDCVLKDFVYNRNRATVSFIVLPKFSEMTFSTKDSLEACLENRKEAYYGSLAHFLSSLTKKSTFRHSGFRVMLNRELVSSIDEFVQHDTVSGDYYLKFSRCIDITYWDTGSRNRASICLTNIAAQFDPAGSLVNPNDFILSGTFAKEGTATMLPRFWKPPENEE